MLAVIGVKSVDDLFATVPEAVRFKRDLQFDPALPEQDLLRHLGELGKKNADASAYPCFLGAGVYHRYIPSVVKHMVGRSEFYTAYTPYQPEASQGLLQAFYEFQTLICQLTAMDVANASLYEGASALAEAVLMARRIVDKPRILVSSTVHPEYLQVLRTYVANLPVEIVEIPRANAVSDLNWLKHELASGTVCAVAAQQPNFFGYVEAMSDISELTKKAGAVMIAIVEPVSLGLLSPPGEYGADIAVGEGQGLGVPVSYGGPYVGFLASRQEFVRKMPGRLIGQTVDTHGRRGFVLTLQAREQHIRREKATSNICTNEALCALAATVHMTALGREGIREIANLSLQKTHYLADQLAAVPGVKFLSDEPFFQEFTFSCGAQPEQLNERLFQQGLIGGLPLGKMNQALHDYQVVAVTETLEKSHLDMFVSVVKSI